MQFSTQIYGSHNNVSVRAKYVKGSPNAQLAENLKFGVCAGMTSRWIRSMQKIGCSPTLEELQRTSPGMAPAVTVRAPIDSNGILQGAYEKNLYKAKSDAQNNIVPRQMAEIQQVQWLANVCEWDTQCSDMVGPWKSDIYKQLTAAHNVGSEWLLRVEIPNSKGDRHAIGIASRRISDNPIDHALPIIEQIAFYIFDANYGMYHCDPFTGYSWLAQEYCGEWLAFRNNIND